MILPAALFLTLISLTLVAFSPRIGLLVVILSRPIIDLSWGEAFAFGFRPVDLIGVGLPAILLFRMLLFSSDRPAKMHLVGFWIFYLFANVLGMSIMLSAGQISVTASVFFRILNGFVAFYIFQIYFSDKDNFRKLLIVYLIAGLFPMLMGLYESITGAGWRDWHGIGEQLRITGLYHNSTSLRSFMYMTLTAIVLYWVYFLKRGVILKSILISYVGICSLVLFKIFSKGGFATIGLGILIWTFQKKQFGLLIGIILAIFTLNLATDNLIFREVSTTYSLETAAIEGEIDVDRMFAGRVGNWRTQLKAWYEVDIFYKLFGTIGSDRGHNDYLRSLSNSGIVGLIAYIALLMAIGLRVLANFRTQRNPLNIMAVIIYCAWMIETLGASPSMSPGYQFYVWGFIGLALHGVKDLSAPIRTEPSARITAGTVLKRKKGFAK